MKKKKGYWLRIGAMCLALCLCACLAACGGEDVKQTTGSSQVQPPAAYTLRVMTEGGSALSDVTVFVYADSTLEDLVAVAKTDKEGKAEFTYATSDSYVAVLTNVPQGYIVEEMYAVSGETTEIKLSAELVEGELENITYKLGDVMQDFTVTAADGTEYKLSELLKEKKAVIMNFWFLSCNPCKQEFPYLQEAYTAYQDVIEVLAVDPVDQDNAAIASYAKELGLTFPMGAGDPAWEKAMKLTAYPTTVVIDRYGTVALVHTGTLPDTQKFKDIFAFFTSDDYVQTVVEDAQTLFTTEPETDRVENPVDISGQTSFQLTVDPGKIHYLNIHKVSNVWLQVNNSDIYVEYGGKKFTPSNGSVGLLVSAPSTFEPAQIGFGNSGDKVQTFTVTLSNLAGSYDNPHALQIGEFTVSEAAGNDQGVYFSYTAARDGFFKLECLGASPGVEYDFSVMNLATSAMRNLSGEGETNTETGRKAVIMPMNQGEKLRIIISTLPDEYNNYPAATFRMLASFDAGEVEDVVKEEKAAYGVTVTDENRVPVAGVNISLTGSEGGKASAVTDENGVAALWIKKDTYTGTMVIPAGYKANTTQFELTTEQAYISLKLDTVVPEEKADYTVRVTDDAGKPMENVVVVIGSAYGNTDAQGVYTANLTKDTYSVMIVVPMGYTSESMTYSFPEGSSVLDITLTKQNSSTGGSTGGMGSSGGSQGGSSGGSSGGNQGGNQQTGTTYTVTLVDAIGGPVTDVVVTIEDAAGVPVSISKVDSTGKTTVSLQPGEYTLGLISASGAPLSYDAAEAKLTAEKTEATVTVAALVDESTMGADYWGNFYRVYAGSTKVDLTKTANKAGEESLSGNWMFMFYPATSGVYTFTISDGAELTTYGTVVLNKAGSTADGAGSFDVTVREGVFANGNQPVVLLGVAPEEGVTEAYITVTRTADAPSELPVTTYTAATQPKPFSLSESGTITYVDLQGSASIVKKSDGYYIGGEKLYVNIGKSAPYVTMSDMMGLRYDSTTGEWTEASTGTGLKGAIYEDDQIVGIEDFTLCMWDYIKACDPVNGLYPLNDDLIKMFQSAGAYMGWWNEESPNYRFSDLSSLNTDIAWMFACCYVN